MSAATADRLVLREGAPAVLAHLSTPQAEAVKALGLVTATRTETPGVWEVAAARKVGVVRLHGLEVVVQPKIPIDRLVFLMGYALAPDFWLNHSVHLEVETDL